MRATLIEWAVGVVFVTNIALALLGVLFPEGPEQKQAPKQTQSAPAPAPSTVEIQSDWK